MTTQIFRRPPRQTGPQLPEGELTLESPPELPEQQSPNVARYLMVLPMLAGGGAMAFMYAGRMGGSGPLQYVIGGMFGLSMLGMLVVNLASGGGNKKSEVDAERRDYMRYLAQTRRSTRRAAAQQREAMLWRHPDPEALPTLAESNRLWERRPTDEDFADVRIAMGAQQLSVRLVAPDTKPVEDLEPMSAIALRRFVRAQSLVPELPLAVSLRAFSRLVLRGDRIVTTDLTRALMCQLATFHAPDDLRLVVVAADERQPEWDWAKWLPHALHPTRTDGGGAERLVYRSLADAEQALAEELGGRSRHKADASPLSSQAHVVVVLDGGEVSPTCQLIGAGLQGTTVVDLSGAVTRDTGSWLLCLEVTDTAVRVYGAEGPDADLGRPDRLAPGPAAGLARQLAPYRLSGAQVAADEPMAHSTELPDLLQIGDVATLDVQRAWQPRAHRDQLRIPLGLSPEGAPVDLDIKEAAQQGMGPHGLCIGATGSGKSELLRTVVAALAATHSSRDLNFVLVDFKGGATFASLDVLPHTSAVITNLADELSLVDRMHDALAGEMVRRQELLRAAGNYVSRAEYEKARAAGEPLDPMPSLFIVCDEFSELLAAKPDFIDLFVMIGRLGRSLGVHLLLASQRLEEGKLRGLDTHLSYRIGLRTFSASESRIVLGVQSAYELPNEPGHGYLKTDTQTMLRFRAAYVSGPYRRPQRRSRPQAVVQHQVAPYGIGHIPEPEVVEPEPEQPAEEPGEEAEGKETSMLDMVVDRLRGQGPPAHQVWLPPLAEPPSLDSLLPALAVDPQRGLCPTDPAWQGRLAVPVGEVDRPYEQRRDPMMLSLDGAGGNVVIVGGPRSGKSTVLRSMLSALALTHTPAEVQFFCLDFGGGALRTLDGLPHMSGVAARRESEAVRRTVAEVSTLMEEREARFTEMGIDSIGTYRRKRARGEITDDPFGDVFLVVDGWGSLREDYEELEQMVGTVAARGLGFGVHLVLTASRWAEIRMNLRDLLGTRLELRLGDPNESETDRKAAANVPESSPGRGLTRDKLHFLSAVSRIDGSREVDDLTEATGALVSQVAQSWPGAPAPKVRLLPRSLPMARLREVVDEAAANGRELRGVPIGINESHLAPVALDFAVEPHLLVFGDAECGKTNLMRLIAESIVARHTPDEARLVIADYRRGLLGAIETEHLLEYTPSGQALSKCIGEVRGALGNRLPGPDVTPAQLRDRSWWRGPELYLMVDDYDLVVSGMDNPLSPLLDLLPQARDIGLHVIVTRRSGGAGRAMYEPMLQRLRELDVPGLLMSGNREEGQLFGNLRPSPQPPGRGTLVRRSDGRQLIQTALLEARES